MPSFKEDLQLTQDLLEPLLFTLTDRFAESSLKECARYSLLKGGKRFRAHLTLMTGDIIGAPASCCLNVAAAVEIVHAYSLMHDDLPVMDNSDMRRSKPSAHIAFDEATALLAGNGLLTYAFQHLCTPACHEDPQVRLNLIHSFTQAIGFDGMMLGQIRDIQQEGTTLADLKMTESLKTGHLMAFCVQAPLIMRHQNDPEHPLMRLAEILGLVYQMIDDLLDSEGTTAHLGKPTRQDTSNRTKTFMNFYKPHELKSQAENYLQQALKLLPQEYNPDNQWNTIADFVLNRCY